MSRGQPHGLCNALGHLVLVGLLAGSCCSAFAASAASEVAPVELRLDPRTPYFRYQSSVPVGDKGESALDVGVPANACGMVWAFDHAELTVLENRFGGVQLVEIPEPGCTQCRPLRVRWYHEPTGRIQFKVDVYRRAMQIACGPEVNSPQPKQPKPYA